MNPTPITADTLLRHASGLRALARGLLVDEHAADDVVQDTWIAALERPPGNPAGLSGWLREVARRLALKRRRGEGRRGARERAASVPEALAATDEAVAEREIVRLVVHEVLALAEPYQSVVFLRYYRDLPPRAIAAELGVPVTTIRSQLARARSHHRLASP